MITKMLLGHIRISVYVNPEADGVVILPYGQSPSQADQSCMALTQAGAHSTNRSNEDHHAVATPHQGFTGSNKTQFTVSAS